jgi:hypothetical protein
MTDASQHPHAPSSATNATGPRRAKEHSWKLFVAAVAIIALARAFGLKLHDGRGANPPAEINAQVGALRADYEAVKAKLAAEQAVLARYEAEHREWATSSMEKMKTLFDSLPAEAAELAKSKSPAEVDAFIAERRKQWEWLTEEVKSRLPAIKRKLAEIDATKKQLREIESRLGSKPTSRD